MQDLSVAAWIAPRLRRPTGGEVGSVVPEGFKAYARILHPVPSVEATTWAAVCAATGRTPHALMQWRAIAGVVEVTGRRWRTSRSTRTMEWPGQEPEEGNLDPAALAELLSVLERHTATAEMCYFALWEGYGWISGSPAVAIAGSSEPIPPAFSPEVMAGPRLRHPLRDYLLFTGPLRAALAMGSRTGGWFPPQSPSIFWPQDRSWCVATEIDFDSTLLGGSAGLIEAVLAHPVLEAWPVFPGNSLRYDADTVNG